MPKITGYGELLLRMTPAKHGGLIEQSSLLQMDFGGAEANILTNLSFFGHDTSFVSALPDNPIGASAFNHLKSLGVNMDNTPFYNGRMGVYYIEHGHSIRGGRVTYDRADSTFCYCIISEKEWDTIMKTQNIFVLTGVTPALSILAQENVRFALEAAKRNNVKVAFDLNYRRTLWSVEDARKSFDEILPNVDFLFANLGSAQDLYNFPKVDINSTENLIAQTRKATDFLEEHGHFSMLAMTMRLQESANKNHFCGLIKAGKNFSISKPIYTDVLDRIGGGDAFVSGVLHGLSNKWGNDKTVHFATTMYAALHTQYGDINRMKEEEIQAIADGDILGYLKR
ncbi:MAG: sugar kinase [Saprospiraceae bacterium]